MFIVISISPVVELPTVASTTEVRDKQFCSNQLSASSSLSTSAAPADRRSVSIFLQYSVPSAQQSHRLFILLGCRTGEFVPVRDEHGRRNAFLVEVLRLVLVLLQVYRYAHVIVSSHIYLLKNETIELLWVIVQMTTLICTILAPIAPLRA